MFKALRTSKKLTLCCLMCIVRSPGRKYNYHRHFARGLGASEPSGQRVYRSQHAPDAGDGAQYERDCAKVSKLWRRPGH